MIGVLASAADRPFVDEFFELFKTPWEVAVPGRRYAVLLSTDGQPIATPGTLTLIYGSGQTAWDREAGLGGVTHSVPTDAPQTVTCSTDRFPLYGPVTTFASAPGSKLATTQGAVDFRTVWHEATVHRIGYDLFTELRRLLTSGQPPELSGSATLELHIDIVRQSIAAARLPIVEVPPAPVDAEFACSLTHDVDFFGIRRHRGDATLAGFALRATLGTAADTLRGRRPLSEAMRNVAAALSLPLVFLGWRRDLWQPLADYALADRGLPSTFFIVPFKDTPGVGPDGRTERSRAVKYGARDVSAELRAASGTHVEWALHGLDAWRDPEAGRAERRELADAAGHVPDAVDGVRMHWLYFSEESPRHLEAAGFAYDSTCGHNDAVGYRAGTLQAFRPAGCDHLLELPLAIMDTAMFYLSRMGLTRRLALERCRTIFDTAARFGGAVVINWHDRSLSPERQWHHVYNQLLDDLQTRRVWFATATNVAAWFRWRRAIRFAAGTQDGDLIVDAPPPPAGAPAARLVVRRVEQDRSVVTERSFAGGVVTVTL
jgi:hypothetical protein